MKPIELMTAEEISNGVSNGSLDPLDIAEAVIARVDSLEPKLNAFTTFEPEEIRAQAKQLKMRLDSGEKLGPMAAVPFVIKATVAIEGKPATAGLVALKDNVAKRDAAIYRRMVEADGLFIGQTTLPEAAYAGIGESHLYGASHNPWKKGFSAGGSSTGSTVAVASGMVPLGEGSDGAGSVRIPASLCGVVGFKPSLGRIPSSVLPVRYETHAFHGPIARTVTDATMMFQVLSGPDEEDPLSMPDDGTNYLAEIQGDIQGLRVAYSPDLGTGYDIDPEVADICREAAKRFEELGATVTEASPSWENIEQGMWESVWVPGASSLRNMIDWEAYEGQVDPELVSMLKESDQLTVTKYGEASLLRGAMWTEYVNFMKNYDVIISPTLTHPAHKLGQVAPDHLLGESVRRKILGWLLTYPFNMLTVPAISMPAGFTSDGLPVGLQIAGKLHADALVLRAAKNFEEIHNLWEGDHAKAPTFESFD